MTLYKIFLVLVFGLVYVFCFGQKLSFQCDAQLMQLLWNISLNNALSILQPLGLTPLNEPFWGSRKSQTSSECDGINIFRFGNESQNIQVSNTAFNAPANTRQYDWEYVPISCMDKQPLQTALSDLLVITNTHPLQMHTFQFIQLCHLSPEIQRMMKKNKQYI